MQRILLALIFLTTALACRAQFGYETYQKVDGVEFSTKWGKAKDENGEKKTALLLRVKNHNEQAASFDFDINLYYEGILRETGEIRNECLEGCKTSMGKLNGIYFIPQSFTENQLKNGDFSFSLDEISVEKTDGCDG